MSKNKKRGNNDMLLPGMEAFSPDFLANAEDDQSLEAELMELVGGGTAAPKQTKQKTFDPATLNLNLDENIDEDDEFDENDPELLAEFNSLLESPEKNLPKQSPEKLKPSTSILNEQKSILLARQQNYQTALNNAKQSQQTSLIKRYERSLKLISELLKKLSQGVPVNEDEIPPQVTIKQPVAPQAVPKPDLTSPPPKKSSPPAKAPGNSVLQALVSRQNEYKHAALAVKESNIERAKGLMIVYKQFNEVIDAVKSGEQFDLGDMPPPPDKFDLAEIQGLVTEEEPPSAPNPAPVVKQKAASQNTPLSFEEELKSRMDFYQTVLEKAKAEGNQRKIKMHSRTVDKYKEAIVAYKKNDKTFEYEELLPPYGKEKLSLKTGGPNKAAVQQRAVGQPAHQANPSRTMGGSANSTITMLKEKQQQFRKAALDAKTSGDRELALELLQKSKGIDPMLKAAESGLPVDVSQIPCLPTELDPQFELATAANNKQLRIEMSAEDQSLLESNDKASMFKKLLQVLQAQIGVCQKYREEMRRAGDMTTSKRFEEMGANTKKDLDGLRFLMAKKDAELPQFHYEYKLFSLLQANPDLTESELELTIVQADQLSLPSGFSTPDQLDTYIVAELPFPNDAHQTVTGDWVKKTNCPVYNLVKKFEVNAKSRVFQRTVKNKSIKIEIYYKKGIFSKDKVLGTVNLKLADLEHNCSVEQLCDIYDGRKLIGGKLEIKLRLRKPVESGVTASRKQVKEKWLVIEDFNRDAAKVDMLERVEVASSNVVDLGSVDVLRFEIGEMKRVLGKTANSGNSTAIANVKKVLREKEHSLAIQEAKSNSKDPAERLAYNKYLNGLVGHFMSEAKKILAAGNREKAQTMMTKKSIVEKEIARRHQ